LSTVLLVVLFAFLMFVSAEARFLLRAGFEESRILLKRRPLQELVADPATATNRRSMFQLVLDAKQFAAEVLGLAAGNTYSTFSDVGRDTLLLVLSASPKYALEPHIWRYPIAGAVAYKGYFSERAARKAEERLEARGYDTYLRPAGAFSTLGWFDDPLLSTALSSDPVVVVATVIHEIAHNTLYVPGSTAFNESFASFVGYRGAERFFAARGDSSHAERAGAIWRDERLLGDFYAWLAGVLESLYGDGLSEVELATAKDSIFAVARDRLQRGLDGRLTVYQPTRLANRTMNNASVVAARLYRTRLGLFDTLLTAKGDDLRAAVADLAAAQQSRHDDDPFTVLHAMLSSSQD
jgi:predicted aminopeptidase